MGDYDFANQTHLLTVQCGLTDGDIPSSTDSAVSDTKQLETRSWSPVCYDPNSNGGINFGDSTHGMYEQVYIPVDKQIRIVSGTGQDVGDNVQALGCINNGQSGCQVCTQGWNKWGQIPNTVTNLQYCRFGTATGMSLLPPGVQITTTTRTILWLSCGHLLTDPDMNKRRDLHASIPHHQLTKGQNLAISTVDGDVYFATLSLDGQSHSFGELQCIRITDVASVPCSTIGAAANTGTKIKTGPCTFTVQDGSSIIAPYVETSPETNSVMAPLIDLPFDSPLSTYQCDIPAAKREVSVPAPYSPDPNCPASNWWSILFYATDGHTYWASVDPDKQWHPMTNMACIRTSDGACVSCNTMGTISFAQVANGALPCSIWAYDSKSYRVEWSDIQDDSGMTRMVPLYTTGSVSGIACGV